VTVTWLVTMWLRARRLVVPQDDSDVALSLGLKTKMLDDFDGGSGLQVRGQRFIFVMASMARGVALPGLKRPLQVEIICSSRLPLNVPRGAFFKVPRSRTL